jgi:hypothetical protein
MKLVQPTADPPPPGSPEARAVGCVCSPQQNRGGAGVYRPGLGQWFSVLYWCPVHGIGDKARAPSAQRDPRPDPREI